MKFYLKLFQKAVIVLLLFMQCNNLLAQQTEKTITLKGNGISIAQAFEQIEKQTNLLFAYNESQLPAKNKINVNFVNQPLSKVLSAILQGTGFTYKYENKYIVIVPVNSQNIKRTGKIVDEQGESVIGASVRVKGSATGTVTDIEGVFSIETADNAILVVSFIGYKGKEVSVNRNKEISITLEEDAQRIDEVIVLGYNVVKLGQVTGAVDIVSGKTMEYESSPTLENRLQGKTAGVMIASGSGQPGTDNLNIRIRGTGSIGGSNTPLYIMDGVMVEPGKFASLNMDDIEDIQILKDASSAAIYGSRGTNGVVVITTKSGKSGKTQFNYKNQFGWAIIPDYIDMMNSEQNLQYQLQCYQSDPKGTSFPLMGMLGREAAGTATQAELERLAKARATDTDWIDVMTQTGFLTEHSLSAAGGNEKTKFYLSGSYLDQSGVLKKSGLNRYSGRFNIEHKANKHIDLGLKMTAGYSQIDFSDPEGTTSRNSWANPWFTALLAYPYESPDDWHNKDNPSYITKYYDRKQNKLKAIWSGYVKVNILSWLYAKTNFGMDYMNDRSKTTLHRDHPNASGNKGSFNQENKELSRYTWTNTINAIRDFENGHSLSAVIGFELFKGQYYNSNFTGYDLDPYLMESPAGIGDKIGASTNRPRVDGGSTVSSLESYFSQVGYSIGKKYNFSGSLRYDKSSKFAKNNNSAVFWSLGAGWNITEENFVKQLDISWLDMFKVKASYGTTGNQDGVSDFSYLNEYGGKPLNGYPSSGSYGGNPAYVHNRIGNPDLKWESSAQFNIGIDFSVFSGKLYGDINLYHKNTNDLFMNKKISKTSGFDEIITNAGNVVNKGFEISLNTEPIRTKDFSWNLGANFTANWNKITDLGTFSNEEGKFQNGDILYQKGKPLGTWSMVEWAGVNPDNGKVLFYDADGNKTEDISKAPKAAKFKSFEVPYFGGFNTNVTYKGLSVSANFTYAFGYYVMNGARWYLNNHHFNGNKPVKLLDMWMKPGDITDVPRYGGGTQPSPWASQFLEDASYLRLKTLRLSYSIPKELLKKTNFFDNINVYVQGENLHTWTKYTGADPEVNGQLDMLSFPKPRNITLGFDFKF